MGWTGGGTKAMEDEDAEAGSLANRVSERDLWCIRSDRLYT